MMFMVEIDNGIKRRHRKCVAKNGNDVSLDTCNVGTVDENVSKNDISRCKNKHVGLHDGLSNGLKGGDKYTQDGCLRADSEVVCLVGESFFESSIAPRKMRLVANEIRGKSVDDAFPILFYVKKKNCALVFRKMLLEAISNYEKKCYRDGFPGDGNITKFLYILKITVDNGKMYKRSSPAPHGMAHIVRKRFSNIYIAVGEVKFKENNIKNGTKN